MILHQHRDPIAADALRIGTLLVEPHRLDWITPPALAGQAERVSYALYDAPSDPIALERTQHADGTTTYRYGTAPADGWMWQCMVDVDDWVEVA